MPTPGEHKTVQASNLAYAMEVGWAVVPRKEAERRRVFIAEATVSDRAKGANLYFEDMLDAQVRRFNQCYAEASGPAVRTAQLNQLRTDIYGYHDVLHSLRNKGKFFDTEEDRAKEALTELFDEAKGTNTRIILERIVGDIEAIVKTVRFGGCKATTAGEREVQQALRRTLLKYQLHRDQELFDKAYGYIREYY